MEDKTSLKKNQLGFLEVVALSVAIIAPTFASSMNFGMIVSDAGYSIELVLIISIIALIFVAFAFVGFGKEFASAGSAYTYIEAGLGKKVGTISGWALLLTYGCWTSGCASAFGYLFGDFIYQITGISISWVVFTFIALAIIWYITYNDIELSTRVMLFIEIISIILVMIVAIVILFKVNSTTGLSLAPFTLSKGTHVTAIGTGMVAAMLSFGGFEGAASLGEESKNPKKYIPIAIMSTVIFAGAIYLLLGYAEISGFGLNQAGLTAFAGSGSTIVELSGEYMGNVFTALITVVISVSAFSTALGSMTASSRALYQLGKDGKVSSFFGRVHAKHNTPYVADTTIGIVTLIPVIGLFVMSHMTIDGFTVFFYVGTIGTIGLILVYFLTCISAISYFGFQKKTWTWQNIAPMIGAVLLLYVLWSNVCPSSLTYPYNIFPYIALTFIVVGCIITFYTSRKRDKVGIILEKKIEE